VKVIVIGVGNVYRGDDGAGPHVARLVRNLTPPNVEVLESDGDAATLINAWQGADLAIVVDVVLGQGSEARCDAMKARLPRSFDGRSWDLVAAV
jgi:hydrogenase maturation protease